MIWQFTDDVIRRDGLTVAAASMVPFQWAYMVRGSVLEVGLGHGLLAHNIGMRQNVTRHVVVEQYAEVIEYVQATGRLAKKTEVRYGRFPCGDPEPFDFVLLDIPDPPLADVLPWLADCGAVMVRK